MMAVASDPNLFFSQQQAKSGGMYTNNQRYNTQARGEDQLSQEELLQSSQTQTNLQNLNIISGLQTSTSAARSAQGRKQIIKIQSKNPSQSVNLTNQNPKS